MAIFPSVNLISPAPGSHVHELPGSVAISYQLSVPEPLSTNIYLFFNGFPMTQYTQEWQPGTVYGYVPYYWTMSYGVYNVTAQMTWMGGSHNYSWSFTWQQDPGISYNYPGQGMILPSSPSHVEAVMFLGRPHVDINNISVSVDGTYYPYYLGMLDENEAFIGANLSSSLEPGSHNVRIVVSTSLGDMEADWEFTIDALVQRQYNQDFRMFVPGAWTCSKDVEMGGMMADIVATGPALNDVLTNVNVMSFINWTMLENSSSMLQVADSIVAALQSSGVRCGMMESPKIVELSGHMAVQYSIQWYDLPIIQRQVILINQDSHRFWVMTFTVNDGQYFWLGELFDAMESSFTLLSGANHTLLTEYDYWGEFTIPIPDTWNTAENITLFSGSYVDLTAWGPILDDYRAGLVVMSERNSSASGDRAFLGAQVQEAVEILTGHGVGVTLREEVYTNVSGKPAVIFMLDLVDPLITEKVMVLVDEESHTVWVVACASSISTFDLFESDFDSIITGMVVHPRVEDRPPSAPSGLHLVAGDGSVTINWTMPEDYGTANITGYEVYRGNSSGSLAQIASLSKNVTTYIDTELQNSQVYYYQVRAVSSAGQGNFTEVVAATPNSAATFSIDTYVLIAIVAMIAIAGIGAGALIMRRKR